MDVFHYLAVRLQHIPLFEAASAEPGMSGGSKGSIYNDFQRNKLQHWHPSSTVPPPKIAENIESMSGVVPQQILDEILLHEDESDDIRYSYDSPLFASNCGINTSQYYYKVFKIVVVACHKMKLHGEDSSKYHARYRIKWGGADTFYDSWLLLNGLKRESFQLDKFEKMFPNWLVLHKWYKKHPHTAAKCKMPIPACVVIENTPVDFQITNCDPVVPPVDTTVDVKPIIKINKTSSEVIVISSDDEKNT